MKAMNVAAEGEEQDGSSGKEEGEGGEGPAASGEEALLETGTLSSAYGTRQRPKNIGQRLCRALHSA